MAGFGQPTAVDVQPTAVDCQPTTVTRRPALCCGPSVSEPGTFFCFLALRTALIRPLCRWRGRDVVDLLNGHALHQHHEQLVPPPPLPPF